MSLVGLWLLLPGVHARAAETGPAGLHAAWDAVLQTHVTEDGRVDYEALLSDPGTLDRYLGALGRADVAGMTRDGRLAFWINAYNAFTVKLILNHYPVKSIRDIRKPWDRKEWTAGGRRLSLNEIEHEILRKDFKEPRIHFAIVCASIGCPDLWNRAYTGNDVNAQLAMATGKFMRSPKHVRTAVERRLLGGPRRVLHVSRIFKWFAEDFADGGTRRVADYVALYADANTADFIRNAGAELKVRHLDYDWGLNGR
jgi:hypothetical protein